MLILFISIKQLISHGKTENVQFDLDFNVEKNVGRFLTKSIKSEKLLM
jgi:hypothetical protein